MVWYFAYGSNMNPDRMKERGIKFYRRVHAVLDGYRLEFNKLSSRNPMEGYANIIPAMNEKVEGILYEIEEESLKRLDQYEGHPQHYCRMEVTIKLDDGHEVGAVTYIARPEKCRVGLKPTKEYLNHLLKGADLLSREYIKKLSKVETLD